MYYMLYNLFIWLHFHYISYIVCYKNMIQTIHNIVYIYIYHILYVVYYALYIYIAYCNLYMLYILNCILYANHSTFRMDCCEVDFATFRHRIFEVSLEIPHTVAIQRITTVWCTVDLASLSLYRTVISIIACFYLLNRGERASPVF